MELPKLLPRGAGSFKFSTSPSRFHTAQNARPHKKIWVVFLLLLTSILLFYYFKGNYYHVVQPPKLLQGYGVVIDMGRQETRVNILQFEETETVAIKVLGTETSAAPYNVPVLLENLLEFANGFVPEVERAVTRVYFLATGGLDWVPDLNRVDLLEECRKSVHKSQFLFRDEWAIVLNGREEGVYEWVAANYARSMVKIDPTDTIGVLNLGDESAQVTFVSEKALPFAYFNKIDLWGTTHNLYSYSFDKLGLETASKSLLKLLHAKAVASAKGSDDTKAVLDPCSPRGSRGINHFGHERTGEAGDSTAIKQTFPTISAGNFTNCQAESFALLQQGQEACHDKDCPAGTVFVPELRGNFIATGKFYETSKLFSLPAMSPLSDLVSAGEKYCAGEIRDVINSPFPEYEAVRKPCFSAAFIVAFLHDSLGLPVSGSKVMFTDAVNSVPVEWTLGFFLTHLLENKSKPSHPMIVFGDIFGSNVALFLGVSAAFGVAMWFVARWRRPQVKTIYDLEKGNGLIRVPLPGL